MAFEARRERSVSLISSGGEGSCSVTINGGEGTDSGGEGSGSVVCGGESESAYKMNGG